MILAIASQCFFKIIGKRVRMEGMLVFDFLDQRDAFLKDMSGWIKSGAIVWEETVTDGLENAPTAFMGLFKGDNMGKSLVRLG